MTSSTPSSEKPLPTFSPFHVYQEFKTKRGDGIRRVAYAIVGAYAAHATTISISAPPASPAYELAAPWSQHRADLRARLRAESFTVRRQDFKEVFAVPLMPERPKKRSRVSPDGSSKDVLADRLHNKRVDFTRSQGNAQLFIAASNASDKTFGNLLRNSSETAKYLLN